MATYFHGGNPEMETDGLRTLYLMNPNYISAYNSSTSEASQQQQATTPRQNMILQNSALHHALGHTQVSHAPPSTQSQFLSVPFAQAITVDDQSRSGNSFHYSLWGGGGGGGGQVEVSTHPYQIQVDNSDVFRRPAAVSPTTNQQGLSLSLSSQPGRGGGSGNGNFYNSNRAVISVGGSGSTPSAAQVTVAGGVEDFSSVQNYIMGSKYLKAAQELLDEVVNVGKTAATTTTADENQSMNTEKAAQMNNKNRESEAEAGGSGGPSRPVLAELTITQKQELQMKKTKLINMLDEVEQRYRQYHHQMKMVVASFEQVAGIGSARSYTSLALKTISKQFRCLKDAITTQLKETSKSLGEEAGEDCLGVKSEGSRRLRMIDHQLGQQRALQQLGMIQHNAWRPQRGLPERAVSVLRAWLFEHFLHPYPKDSDKHMLAKQTGLTRNQVSNWFINARVRLWKPMVEEMYLEEVKDQQDQKGSNQDSTSNNNAGQDPSHKQQQQQQQLNQNEISNSTISTSPNGSNFQAQPPGFTLIGTSSSDMNGLLQFKKPRGAQETENSPSSILSAGEISFSRRDHLQSNNLTSKFAPTAADYNNSNNVGGFGAYHQLGELGRFTPDQQLAQSFHQSNNGNVSLTLGLPPGENLQPSFFSGQNMHGFDRGLQMSGNGPEGDDFCGINGNTNPQTSPHSNMGFQNMDISNRKRYAAQLLPDFVA